MPIRLGNKVLIFLAVLVVLCNYYYFYFVDFYQGATSVGLIFSFSKLVGVLLVCLSFLRFSLGSFYDWKLLGFLVFFIIASAVYFFKGLILGFVDGMFLNAVVCVVPLLLFQFRVNCERVRFFFECSLIVLAAQVAVDQLIFLSGRSLWENKAFVGGVGNPSSFGLLCNILICYVLFERKPSFASAMFCLVLSYAVCRTSSLLALILLYLVFVAYLCEAFSFKRLLFVFVILFVSVFAGGTGHLFYKVNSVIYTFSEVDSTGSTGSTGSTDPELRELPEERVGRSVSTRLQNNIEYIERFSENPVGAFLYGFEHKAYMGYDSQVLTYLSSFGVFVSLLFFLPFTALLFRCWSGGGVNFISVALLLFGVTFFTNRILGYYPIPIFFAVLVVFANGNFSGKILVYGDSERSPYALYKG